MIDLKMNAETIGKCFRDLYQSGLTTSSGGNISVLQTNKLVCISPSQIDKACLKPDDFAYLTTDGEQTGENKPSMESPFHLSIYRKFPDVRAIVHIHPAILVALSLLPENTPELKKLSSKFKFAYAAYAMPGSRLLGEKICKAIDENVDVVLMQNHGVIAIGTELQAVIEQISKFIELTVKHFNLEPLLNEFELKGKFNFGDEDKSGFFESRANHFLSVKNSVKFNYYKEKDIFYSSIQLRSLSHLTGSVLSTRIIPESYLILKNPLFLQENFNVSQIQYYLRLFDEKASVLIFQDGWALISGASPYHLFDKMEVLDFTAKVTLIAREMGNYNLLTDAWVQELKAAFLVK